MKQARNLLPSDAVGRTLAIAFAVFLASSAVSAQPRGAPPPAPPPSTRAVVASVRPAVVRPTFLQRVRGAIRGAVQGFRLGNTRAASSRRQLPDWSSRVRMLGLPDVRQANDYTCGAASLQSILRYFGVGDDEGEEELARRLGTTPQNGTTPSALVRVAREHGLRATIRERLTIADLKRYVARGVPVIVDYQAWSEAPNHDYTNDWENGHYSVVVGVDDDTVYLEDPSILGARGTISRADFEARWHDEDEGRRYHGMGIVIESPNGAAFQTRVRRTVPTE